MSGAHPDEGELDEVGRVGTPAVILERAARPRDVASEEAAGPERVDVHRRYLIGDAQMSKDDVGV